MSPNRLIVDIAAVRQRDLLVEAQHHRRVGLARHGRSLEAGVQAAARRVARIWTIRGVPEAAAA